MGKVLLLVALIAVPAILAGLVRVIRELTKPLPPSPLDVETAIRRRKAAEDAKK